MRKKEQLLYDALKRNAPRGAWLQRIENLAGVGQPDVIASLFEGPIWVELKAPYWRVRPTTPVLGDKDGLNPDQIKWHRKAHIHGFNSWVLIRDTSHNVFLVPSAQAYNLNRLSRDALAEMGAQAPPQDRSLLRWAWNKLLEEQ